jgi:hypothetical protein
MRSTTRHCPHCLGDITASFPPRQPEPAVRCSQCRLLVAAGRSIDAAEAARQRQSGVAANVLGSAARREAGQIRPLGDVAQALRDAASEMGCAVERLRMVDYDVILREAPSAEAPMTIADVIATHGSWKAACKQAGAEEGAVA